MPESKLYLFGPPRLAKGNSHFEIQRRKAIALLCYLAISQQTHSRDALADLFWPGYSQSEARGHLRRTLFVINQSPAAPWVKADRSTLALAEPSNLWVDVLDFKAKIRAHSHPPTHSPSHSPTHLCDSCIPDLERAVGLYTDHFLAGFTLPDAPDFDEWQQKQDQEVRRQLGEARAKLVDAYTDSQAWPNAISHAQHRITLDPLNEEAHRHLMRVYARAQRHAEALHQYQECLRILDAEIGMTPSAETTELVNQIRQGLEEQSPSAPVRTPATLPSLLPQARRDNLPVQTMPFMGREQELAQIAERLADANCRLLTLTGLGGVGKTRLAQQAMAVAIAENRFEHGVFWVSLAGNNAPEALAASIANALGYNVSGNADVRIEVLDYLRNKSMLLILDNFEHILAATDLLSEILLTAADVKLMVTSRELLNLQEEWVLPLAGLRFPSASAAHERGQLEIQTERAGRESALQLFLFRARQVRPSFDLAAEYSHVVAICQLVEGMPLAIELAAAWLKVMPCARIATELQRGLDLLTSPLRNVPERHRTMRSVFASSFSLLTAEDRLVIARLSLLRGSFDEEAAQQIASASFWNLAQLVEKSLLRSRADGRYELHELVRQYALEQLTQQSDQHDETRRRLRSHYCNKLRAYSRVAQGGARQEVVAALESDFGNFRLAWRFAVEQRAMQDLTDGLDLLASFLEWRGRFAEGELLCIESVEALPPNGEHHIATLRIRLHTWQSTFYRLQGRIQEARALAQRARQNLERATEFSEVDLSAVTAELLAELGQIAAHSGEIEEALSYFAESRTRLGVAGLAGKQARILLCECLVLRNYVGLKEPQAYQAQLQRASALAEEALRIYREFQDQAGIADALHNLAIMDIFCHYREGAKPLQSARGLMAEALEIYSELGIRSGVLRVLYHYAVTVISDDGNFSEASMHLHQLLTLAQELGSRKGMMHAQLGLGWVALAESRFEDAALHGSQGVTMAREMNEPNDLGIALGLLGSAERKGGKWLDAWRLLAESLQLVEKTGSTTVLWYALPLAGLLLTDRQRYALSAEVYALIGQYTGLHDVPCLLNLPAIELAAAVPEEMLQALRPPRPITDFVDDLLGLCHKIVGERGEVPPG